MVSILHQVALSPSDQDSLIWAPSKKGYFSVKSLVIELTNKARNHHSYKTFNGLRKGLVPFRIEIFTWLVIQGKLNTKVKLANLGIIPLADSSCTFCGLYEENLNHLLLQCPFFWSLWAWWLHLWDLNWALLSPFLKSSNSSLILIANVFSRRCGVHLFHHFVVYVEGA